MENNNIYGIIHLDDKLNEELVSVYQRAEVTNPWVGLLEDGTAKPPPAPAIVKSLESTDERHRAETLWYYVFRLECLLSQWNDWLCLVPMVGEADPTLAFNLDTGVKDCVRILCGLGLFKEPEAQVFAAFPDPERAPFTVRWHRWPEGKTVLQGWVEQLRRLKRLRDGLWWCLRTLEKTPEALFVAGTRSLTVEPPDAPTVPAGNESPAPPAKPEPAATPGDPAGALTGNQGHLVEPISRQRKRRRKLDARLLLIATLDSLAGKGQWGKTDKEIIIQAEISRDTFYRLKREDKEIGKNLLAYRRKTLGRGPVRADEL